jgi:phosphate-selective porin OprO and OprP
MALSPVPAGQIVSGKDYSLHIGGEAEWLQPPHNLTAGTQTLTLSDRPELRIDPTILVSTGALAGVSVSALTTISSPPPRRRRWTTDHLYA